MKCLAQYAWPVVLLFAALCATTFTTADDWPMWRGPQGNGVADPEQKPPLEWSAEKNVVWKAKVPGRGHSSPTVFGDYVFLATAEEVSESQSVLCYDRASGDLKWKMVVHEGGLDKKGNPKTTQASSTAACDGERVYVNFLNKNAIYTTALDLSGKRLWETRVSGFKTHQGFGSSPTLYGDLVLVTTDSPGGGVVAALDRATGEVVWQHERPEKANYASAVICRIDGRDLLVMQGCDVVAAFEPTTGKKLWEVEGSTTECVANLVTDGKHVFVSGGYPKQHVQAIVADGSGKTAWENGSQVYVPSMIVKDDYLYAMQDPGFAMCWKCDTGEEQWKIRVGETFSASLSLVNDLLFATSESGKTTIFKATPESFELVAENQLGDEAYATPSICGGRIYMRVVEKNDSQRQEWLYCLGE
jgi:outer membrane protein assembly factor BamB